MRTERVLQAIALLVLAGGCVTAPKNTKEFREMAGHSRSATIETREVGRQLPQVFQDLKSNADRCFSTA